MIITRVKIENYKSIKNLDFTPSAKLNAFVGENGVGKSIIFEAINWLLGPIYPTFNVTTKQDHYMGDENNKILIRLEFDGSASLELNECRVRDGKSGLFKNDGQYNCRGDVREEYCSAYIDTERRIVDYLPSNRWSLLGRILLDINKRFLEETTDDGEPKSEKLKGELDRIRDELLFSVKNEEGEDIMQRFITILQEESAQQMNVSPSDFQLNFNLYDPWNFYKTLQILVTEPEIGLPFQASQLGTGAQASITIAILRAYSEIRLRGGNPIFIDEPELFLHPQAQRNLYRILRKLSAERNIQVFYITHSPCLLSLDRFDEIFVIRKTTEKGTYLRNGDADRFIEDFRIRRHRDTNREQLMLRYRNAFEQTADSISSLEAFFSRKIILVEGASEALILPYFFEKARFDYVREKITIVKCGNKNELDRFLRLYSEFGIPCFVIFDGDRDKGNDEEQRTLNNGLFGVLGETDVVDFPDNEVHQSYLGFENDFNSSLASCGFNNVYNEDNPQESPKGLRLFRLVKMQIERGDVSIPNWVEEVKNKIQELADEVEGILMQQSVEEEPEIETPF